MTHGSKYIFSYEQAIHRIDYHLMQLDIDYLTIKHGRYVLRFDLNSFFYDIPEGTLDADDIFNIGAQQILERKDGDIWRIRIK